MAISPYTNPRTVLLVRVDSQGYKVQRNLTIPLPPGVYPQWQAFIANRVDLPDSLYLFSVDYLVAINYNALLWNIKYVMPLSQGLYPTQVLRGATINQIYGVDSLFVIRANLNESRPSQVT